MKMMSGSQNLDTLERAALGRPVSIGQLYDVKDDTCLKANVFHDKENIKDLYSIHESSINYTLDERFSERLSALNLQNDQKLSLLVDLHEKTLPGYHNLLTWRKETERVVRGTFIYTYFVKREEIDMTQSLNKTSRINCTVQGHLSKATHVISSIVWGHQVIVTFDCPIPPEDDRKLVFETLARVMDGMKNCLFQVPDLKKILGETCKFDIRSEIYGDEFNQTFNWNAFTIHFPIVVERISKSECRPLYFNLYPLTKLQSFKKVLHPCFRSIEPHDYSEVEEYFFDIETIHAQLRDLQKDEMENSESLLCLSGYKLNEVKQLSKEIEFKVEKKLANLKLNVQNNRKLNCATSIKGKNMVQLKENFNIVSIKKLLDKFQIFKEPLWYISYLRSKNCTVMSAKKLQLIVKTVNECLVLNCYPEHKDVFKSAAWKQNYKYFLKLINVTRNTTSHLDMKIYFAEHKLGVRIPYLGSLTQYKPSFEPVWISHYLNGQSLCENCLENRDQRLLNIFGECLSTSTEPAKKKTTDKLNNADEINPVQIESEERDTTENKNSNTNPPKKEGANKFNSFAKTNYGLEKETKPKVTCADEINPMKIDSEESHICENQNPNTNPSKEEGANKFNSFAKTNYGSEKETNAKLTCADEINRIRMIDFITKFESASKEDENFVENMDVIETCNSPLFPIMNEAEICVKEKELQSFHSRLRDETKFETKRFIYNKTAANHEKFYNQHQKTIDYKALSSQEAEVSYCLNDVVVDSQRLKDIKGPEQDFMECSDVDDSIGKNENNRKDEELHTGALLKNINELFRDINETIANIKTQYLAGAKILKEYEELKFLNLELDFYAEDVLKTENDQNRMETSNELKEESQNSCKGNNDISENRDTKKDDYSVKYLEESAKNQKNHSGLENIVQSTDAIFQENLLVCNKEPTGHLDSKNKQSISKDTMLKTNNNSKSKNREKKGKKQSPQSKTNKSTRWSDENAGSNGTDSSKNEISSEAQDSLFSNLFTILAPTQTEVHLNKEPEIGNCLAKCEVKFDVIESVKDLDTIYPVLNIMCPATLYNKCKLKLAQVWKCEKCFTNLFYGQDSCIYCQKCGKAPAVKFSFKCSHSSHGDDFFVFENGDVLLGMLEKLRVKNELNILILGETGVGKSTFINAFANYLTYDTLEEAQSSELIGLIPTSFTLSDENYEEITVKFGVEDSNEADEEGASKTQSCKSYVFLCGEKMIRLIDTPGIGDTRGIDQDAKNFVNILSFISNYSSIHGILLLMKPNNSRLSVFFRFCIQELLKHLHKSASENIVFTFTNSKSTFYMPGDTFPPLKRLLGELKDVEIKLNKETVYCLDNDSFRFLVASQNEVKFDDLERKDYSFSWKKSAAECERLLGHVAKLKPHSVKETLSINEARRLIISLAQPLGDIIMLIHENLYYINAQIDAITACKNNSKKLENCLFVPVVDSVVTYLKDPRTVCKSEICSQKEDTFSICHDPCFLTSVTPDIFNNDALLECAILKNGECSSCGCSWKDHMHMRYEIKKIHSRKLDNSAQSSLRNAASRQEKAEETKFALENERMAFLKELDYATKASALFTYFLRTNSITNQTDFVSTYLDHLIRNEKAKEKITKAQPGLQAELQKAKTLYEKEMKSLFELKAQITAQEIDVHITMLYDLPKFGQLFKEIAQQRELDMTNEAALYSEQVFVSKKGSSKLKTFNFDTDL